MRGLNNFIYIHVYSGNLLVIVEYKFDKSFEILSDNKFILNLCFTPYIYGRTQIKEKNTQLIHWFCTIAFLMHSQISNSGF